MPSLDAPTELGHPSYQFTSYGIPIELVIVAKESCISRQSTTFEWFFPGLVIDSLLLGIVLYVWYRQNRGYRKRIDENF